MNRREFLAATAAAPALIPGQRDPAYQVGAYYFPNYHVDPRNEKVHGPGWTEWELVRAAQPRYPGHRQPKRPLWGYEDEADPRVMAKKIDAAADHALNHWLFDWYYYDGPFLNRCLDEGFLKAANNHRLQFALMWANHDWLDIQPAKRAEPAPLQFPGAVTAATFDRITDLIIERYFSHPAHWRIDARPYFSIYEAWHFAAGLGGAEPARAALARFREKVHAAGFDGLHLNAVAAGLQVPPAETAYHNRRELLSYLGFDSVTCYVWVQHTQLRNFPETDYRDVAADAVRYWRQANSEFGLPFHPNVTMGWDSSPRTCQTDRFDNSGYPFTPVLKGNTPAAFHDALRSAKEFLDSRPAQGSKDDAKILTLNAWNEWTEGSYLEPDTENGLAYLQAIASVFGA
ncbi:MAG: glycoside hydrolase family 99-like domain-containing protein [Bryobacteraceae bacterium]